MTVSQDASLGEIKKAVAKIMTWREFNYNCHISLKHRFVYFETPKVGCSSIKYAMMHLELEGFAPRITDPHLTFYNMPTVKPYQLDAGLLYDVLFTDRFFRFSFVRNPFTRTLSAYLDKIKKPKRLAGSISRALGLMPGASSDMTFGEFLDFINATPVFEHDKHWRPQNQVLLHGLIQFHHIGRFERFEEDWQKIIEQTTPRLRKHSEVFNPHATNAGQQLKDYYDSSNYRKLIAAYRNDFRIYDYSEKNLPQH